MVNKEDSTSNMQIFRAYDIRGIYGKDLNEAIAEEIGKAFGTFLKRGSKVGVARDVRLSSDSLHDALVRGLLYTGCQIVDFGKVPVPLLYFGTWYNKLAGGVMVTASHLPPEWNGFKFSDKTGVTMSDGTGLEKIKDIFIKKNFSLNEGGNINYGEVIEDYVDFVSSKITLKKTYKVAFDFGNSVTSLVVPKIMANLKQKITTMNETLDGRFPNRASEPSETSLQGLKKKVLEEKADIGIGYDADGDRVAFVDELGRIFASGNLTIPILAGYLLKQHPKRKIVYDVTCSSAVGDYIRKLGGEPVIVRVGHSFCVSEMVKQNALMGGQYSGHTAFPDVNGADDAIFGSLKLLEALAASGAKLSKLVDDIPSYFTNKVKEIECSDSKKFDVIEEIKKKAKTMNYKLIDIDGVLLYNDNGRVLVRASNTAPVIKVNAEGKTQKDCDEFQRLGESIVEEELKND